MLAVASQMLDHAPPESPDREQTARSPDHRCRSLKMASTVSIHRVSQITRRQPMMIEELACWHVPFATSLRATIILEFYGNVWKFCSSHRFGAGRLQSTGRSAGPAAASPPDSRRAISPERLADTARRAGIAGFVAVTAAAFALIWSVFTNDFSITYILEHSNRALPGPYKFSALWSGQEGSLLLWAWLLGTYGFVLRLTPQDRREALRLRRHDPGRHPGLLSCRS